MNLKDIQAVIAGIAPVVREHVAGLFASVESRIKALEQRQPERGEPGKSVTVEEVTPVIERAVADAVAEIPRPQDGKSVTVDDLRPVIKELVDQIPKPKDGIDGSSVIADDIVPIVIPALEAKAAEVARQAVSELPRPKDGEPGKSVTLEDVLPTVKEWFDALPKPKDGIDGKSITVEDVLPSVQKWFEDYATSARQHIESIPAPKDGRDGIDGKSVTVDDVLPLFNQAFDKWALDFERRAQDIHTRLLASFDKPKDGRDGIDGKNGTDGLGFDDIDITHDGERGFTIAVVRGERRKEFTFQLPVVLERGVFKAGHDYCRGDGVTADGSYWIAQTDKPSGRPGQSPDWRLAVKRGRDGKGS